MSKIFNSALWKTARTFINCEASVLQTDTHILYKMPRPFAVNAKIQEVYLEKDVLVIVTSVEKEDTCIAIDESRKTLTTKIQQLHYS
jgi:hypothetical protein